VTGPHVSNQKQRKNQKAFCSGYRIYCSQNRLSTQNI